MHATEVLMNEHRVIEQVLICLEKMADRCILEGELDAASARAAIDFFLNFAERCHQGKEERHLFAKIEAKGFGYPNGPTAAMRQEHAAGHHALQRLAATVEAAAAGNPKALDAFVSQAREYAALLRAHIAKEDQVMFPMSDRMLSDSEQQELVGTFDHVESHEMGTGDHDKYLRIADELAERFGVPHAHAEPLAGHGCWHYGR